MADVQDTPKPWSQCTPHELLDMAQEQFHAQQGQYATVLVAAARVQASLSLEWTLQDRMQQRFPS